MIPSCQLSNVGSLPSDRRSGLGNLAERWLPDLSPVFNILTFKTSGVAGVNEVVLARADSSHIVASFAGVFGVSEKGIGTNRVRREVPGIAEIVTGSMRSTLSFSRVFSSRVLLSYSCHARAKLYIVSASVRASAAILRYMLIC